MDITHTPRDQRIPVMLTKAEKQALQLAANNAGLNLSTYIRAKAMEAANE